MRTLLCMTVSIVAACAGFGQTAKTSPHFEVADVHPSPPIAAQAARGPFMNGVRYDLRNATVVDLIVKAYGVTPDKVLEGPNWLEYDRFDISAVMPPKTSSADTSLMLQALLVDRFSLAFRKEERPLPAYVLTAPKGTQKLKEADGSGNTGCGLSLADQSRPADPAAALPSTITISYTCRNMTMAAFAQGMTGMALAPQFVGANPVQDKTGIEGKYDFSFKFPLPTGSPVDGTSMLDALDRQLGLKLEQQTISLPVIIVEKANRASPNEPEVAKKIPAFPTEFEVATVKPVAPAGNGPTRMGMRMQPGGRIEFSGLPLKTLVLQAWGIQADSLINAPKWMETDRYDIVAKAPSPGELPAPNTPVDNDSVFLMVRALLADRFKLATHFEDRPMTAYTLTASKPKLKKADPATRTKWSDSSGNGPIILNSNSVPSRTIKFQNMSLAQLAEKLQYVGSTYIHSPVMDATGIEGSYDFTLTFSLIPPAQLATMQANRPPDATGANAADPIGGVSLFEAIDKQLGLKLVEQKRPVRVLVIDHIEEKPTEN